MPDFFFHVRQGGRLIRDDEGLHYDSLDEAVLAVTESVKEISSDATHTDPDNGGGQIEIMDASGKILITIPMKSSF